MGKAADKSTTIPIPLPQMVVANLPEVRKEAAIRINRLINFLDMTDPYVSTELEVEDEGDDNPDDEPSLGAPEGIKQDRTWGRHCGDRSDQNEGEDLEGDELDKQEISDLEFYGENDGNGMGCVDDEPSLGSLDSRISQLRWSAPDRSVWFAHQVFELDHAEQEVGIEDLPHDEETGY